MLSDPLGVFMLLKRPGDRVFQPAAQARELVLGTRKAIREGGRVTKGGPHWESAARSTLVDGIQAVLVQVYTQCFPGSHVVLQADHVGTTLTQFAKLLGQGPKGNCFELGHGQRLEVTQATDGRGTGLAAVSFRQKQTGWSREMVGVRITVS